MGNVILKIFGPFWHEAVATIEALQMRLGTEPDGVRGPVRLTGLHRLGDQPMTQTATPAGRRRDHPADNGPLLIGHTGRHDTGIGRQRLSLPAEQVIHAILAIQPVQILKGTGLLDDEHLGPQGQQVIQLIGGEFTPGFQVPVHPRLHVRGKVQHSRCPNPLH
ncbi:hypothetical protein WL1483_1699 [Aeromonas schubertii]|uniref:Uncharacterized protein n=1 Tax=Aeromonas schubertii TaxID=652 RepID=A0A0S2SHC1_9GAMM|nr:hypothetical protein WL1483_1699 [Aeromonas schubertii]